VDQISSCDGVAQQAWESVENDVVRQPTVSKGSLVGDGGSVSGGNDKVSTEALPMLQQTTGVMSAMEMNLVMGQKFGTAVNVPPPLSPSTPQIKVPATAIQVVSRASESGYSSSDLKNPMLFTVGHVPSTGSAQIMPYSPPLPVAYLSGCISLPDTTSSTTDA
jgi:hypothetical protein